MSEEDELQKLREQRMQELRRQQAEQQQNQMQHQQAAVDAQKQAILRIILSSEARSRLANIRLARPQFAQTIELQLIQAFQGGTLRGQTPLSDQRFKQLLQQLHDQTKTRERQIKFR